MKTWLVIVSVIAVLLAIGTGVGFWMLSDAMAELASTEAKLTDVKAELDEVKEDCATPVPSPTPTPSYTLSVNVNPSGAGIVSPSGGEYDSDEQVTLTASPASGYRFVNWTGDVDTVADVNAASTTITVNDNYSITANFGEGDVAPDFTLPTMTGADITLSELIGTPVVLNFWSISCYWCRKQLPYLENVAQQSGGEIKVIAVNIADNAANVQNFFDDYEPTMIIALDRNRETFRDYGLKYDNPRGSIPFTLFVDNEGIMQYKQTGAFPSDTKLWDTLHSIFEL